MKNEVKYEIVGYEKRVKEYSKNSEIEVDDWTINFEVPSFEDAHRVAKLAGLKSYGLVKKQYDADGHIRGKDERVYVTEDVTEWEAIVKKQDDDRENRKAKVVAAINALPKIITLFKDKEIVVKAERSDCDPKAWRGFDIHYYGEVTFKGEKLGHLSDYLTDGYTRKSVLRKKFAQEIYTKKHPRNYNQVSYDVWQVTLRNLPEDFVEKYGAIVQTAVDNLRANDNKISDIKAGL